MAERVVLYPAQMAAMGKAIAASLGCPAAVCTADAKAAAGDDAVLCWDVFPSASSEKDPNIKVKFEALIGKHVVLLLSQDDTSSAFAQLSLLLWLQRFYVPKPLESGAKRKWKDTVGSGAFDMASVASLTVVVPWYRYCQMERTSRWAYKTDGDKPGWTNSVPDGGWLDVPTAQAYAALLSADPAPPPGTTNVEVPALPPKQILFIDIHDDLNGPPVVECALSKTGKWANPVVQYDVVTGNGTYFASAFAYFLAHTYLPQLEGSLETKMVIFPDVGAYTRFHTMVETTLAGIPKANVLFIEKKRVGTQVEQSETLNYMAEDGSQQARESLPSGSTILIPDDFTNSGSTLFGGAKIVKSKVQGEAKAISAFVSHFVAKYDRAVVDKFVTQVYSEGGYASAMDTFYCTDSIPNTTSWLQEEVAKRVAAGQPKRVVVDTVAPLVCEWVSKRPLA